MLARQLLLSSLHPRTTLGLENHTMRSPSLLLPEQTSAVALCKLLIGLPLFLLVAVSVAQASTTFQPVSADELKMTSEPMAPGAPAILLFHQVDRDDNGR